MLTRDGTKNSPEPILGAVQHGRNDLAFVDSATSALLATSSNGSPTSGMLVTPTAPNRRICRIVSGTEFHLLLSKKLGYRWPVSWS